MGDLEHFRIGEHLTAAKLEKLRVLVERRAHGRRYISDSTGEYIINEPDQTPETDFVHFELAEPYPTETGEPAEAHIRVWDPSAGWSGTGHYVTDCDDPSIYVIDGMGMGFTGALGAIGWGISMAIENGDEKYGGYVTVIYDLQCKPYTTNSCQ